MKRTFRTGQRVIVTNRHDPDLDGRGVIVEAMTSDGITTTAWASDAYIVRWTDTLGRSHITHRWPDELTAAAQVLGPEARVVWHAMRAGARKIEEGLDLFGELRTRTYEGNGITLTITVEVRR